MRFNNNLMIIMSHFSREHKITRAPSLLNLVCDKCDCGQSNLLLFFFFLFTVHETISILVMESVDLQVSCGVSVLGKEFSLCRINS